MNELRQMATFIDEKDVPIGKTDTTHFERFGLFAKLELQKALACIHEANQNYISVLEYFGEDVKTSAADFFGLICQFIYSFDLASVLVEKDEEMKLRLARQALAKEAKLRVISIARALNQTEFEDGTTNRKQALSSANYSGLKREMHKAGTQEKLVKNYHVDQKSSLIGSAKLKNIAVMSSIGHSYSAQNENQLPNRGSIVAIVGRPPRG